MRSRVSTRFPCCTKAASSWNSCDVRATGSPHFVDSVGLAGEDHDGYVGGRSQLSSQGKSVTVRQREVENDQVWSFHCQTLTHSRSAGGGADNIALLPEITLKRAAKPLIVIDDQDSG